MEHKSRIIRESARARTRFPLIGKIRCGEKRLSEKSGKEYPVSLDYFKATGDYAAKFTEAYPGKPNNVQIVFISHDDWESCYEEYDARDSEGRRAGYGDGENFFLWDPKTNEYEPTQDKEVVKDYSEKNGLKWRPVLTLNFLIPKIRGVFGVWQFQTGGDKSSITAIRSVYDELKAQAGTVVNVPFDLTVKKVTSNRPGSKSVYPVVNIVPNISADNIEQLRAFFETGQDIKRLGMLTEEKMQALGEPEKAHTGDGKKYLSQHEAIDVEAELENQAKETPPRPDGKLFNNGSPTEREH